MSSKDECSSNCDGAIAVCRSTLRNAQFSSPPADGGGVGSDFKWWRHHHRRNLYSVFCCLNLRYSAGGYETVAAGRAPTVGDTSGDENECGCNEAAWELAGGETEEADTSVSATVEVSISRRSWSSEISDQVAPTGSGEDGTGCRSGSTADIDGPGDGKAVS